MVKHRSREKYVDAARNAVGGRLTPAHYLLRFSQAPFRLQQRKLFSPGEAVRVQAHHPRWARIPLRQPHTHDFYEITYVHSGLFSQTLDGVRVGQTPGELVLLRPGAEHATWIEHESDVVFNLLLERQFIEQDIARIVPLSTSLRELLSGTAPDRPGHLRFRCDAHLTHLVDRIIAEYFDYRDERDRVMVGLMTLLFSGLTSAIEIRPSREEFLVTRMLHRVDQRFRDISSSALSQEFEYSPRQVSRLLSNHVGVGLTSIVSTHRIERVCRGLLSSEAPLNALVKDAGFTDMNYFYKVFHRVMGITLREFYDLLDGHSL